MHQLFLAWRLGTCFCNTPPTVHGCMLSNSAKVAAYGLLKTINAALNTAHISTYQGKELLKWLQLAHNGIRRVQVKMITHKKRLKYSISLFLKRQSGSKTAAKLTLNYIAATTASPIAEQPTLVVPSSKMSPVRRPWANTFFTAFSTRCAAVSLLKV